ncbi:type II toxin-antitoxin system Phd/YefM family antitoxin [Coleofasciculus sp. FACHB-SPT36]|uniref:type II toxin-antitoxin system Phd/YefM family antitoxin n=2 Tax=Cyanophyceae TaxID=3028117 RepID=UPI00168A6FE8|nr:type II toxin-antitoxin system Phd/YefM family antitoxin [Coleofasciculus sp. FACHB-SPT36]
MRKFSEILQLNLHQVEAAETLIVMQTGKPVAEIRQISPTVKQLQPFALCAGEFTVPDDFDTLLPKDILTAFEGT